MKIKLYTCVRLWMYCILLLVSFSCLAQQVPMGLTAANGTYIGFWQYKPVDYDANPNTKYPLIIFLHGIGERGDGTTQLSYVLANAIPKYISQGYPMKFFVNGQWQTFLVLSPQLSNMYGSWQNFYVDEMLNYAKQNLRVDTNRIYLTGLSLGGGGTWKYATYSLDNASKFAAIMTCCGTCEWSNVCNLATANTPVWSFHAQDDGTVGVGCTTSAISMLNSCNPPFTPLMTIFPTGNHWIWDRAYDTTHNIQNPNVYEWFLMHARSNVPLPPNVPPVANAGPDQSITLPTSSVTLNGTGSGDPDGSIVSYNWAKISGPAQFNISNFDQSTTSVTNLITGTYLFELTVTDNRGATSKDTVAITVNPPPPGTNLPPVAVAGGDVALNTSTYTLTSWGSYDPDGTIVAYQWRKIAGPTQYTMTGAIYATAVLSNLVNGTYTFELQVTDNLGAIGKDSVNVTVALPNNPPIANAGTDQTITLPTNSVTLNGSSSTDPDGAITSYAWSKISGPTSYTIVNAGATSTVVNSLTQGAYLFRLVVTDNNGGTDDDTVAITVNGAPPPPNLPPIANAGADQTITLPTNSVTLNGTASSDPDGAIATYAWTKISGPASTIVNASGATTAVNGLVQGTYSFKLVVTDYYGATGADTIVVVVNAATPPPNNPPVANAGTDQTITLPTSSVTLNGSGSSDADGTISSYAWSKISGPASYSIVNPSAANTLVNGLLQGTYLFRLVVTDNNGATDDDTVVVIVNAAPPPANVPPIANAGADQSVTLPTNTITLNGSGSSDPDGTISSYSWTKINGPSSFSITNANNANTTVTQLVQGTYQFRLVVTDNSGASDDDTVSVTVYPVPPPANLPPIANAGADQTITLPTNSVTLNGSGSSDPDGSIASYAWTKIGGPSSYSLGNPNGVTTSFSGLIQGTYQLQLMVTDNNGASAFDTVLITVNPAPPPPNVPPIANAGADQSITLPTNSVTLNGTASSDADGTITSYSWTKINGPAPYTIANASGSTTAVSGLVQGQYSFRLVVTDNSGGVDDDTVNIVVNAAAPPPNIPPVANAGVDQVITLPTNSITLNGSASTDADGTITSYAWSKISGPSSYQIANANAATTAVNSLAQGTYSFRLVVTDNSGATADDTVLITVNAAPPPPNVPPVANAGADQVITLPTNTVTLSGTASSDADGNIVSYAWTKISGPALFGIGNPYAVTTAVTNLIQGTYMFQLIVTDNNGALSADTVIVTVNPAPLPPNVPPVANAGNDTTITLPNSGLQLSGAASSDPDGGIIGYSWATVSGPSGVTIVNATSVTPTIVGLVAGDYVIRLTVTDNGGATGTDDVTIHVLAQQNLAPIARAGNDSTIAVPSTTAYLNGAASYDPDGRIVRYLWRQIAGPAGPIISNNAVALATVNSMQPGVYSFELTVTDNLGLTGKDTVVISVVDNFRYDEELTIYPNPTQGAAHVRCISDSTGDMLIRILDMNGIVVQVIEAVKAQSYFEKDIQVQTLKSGTYYLEAIIGDKKRMIKKFIKQ